MKQAKDYLAEANAAVPRISAEDGIRIHDGGGAVFIDVRDSGAIAETGTIAGARRQYGILVEHKLTKLRERTDEGAGTWGAGEVVLW